MGAEILDPCHTSSNTSMLRIDSTGVVFQSSSIFPFDFKYLCNQIENPESRISSFVFMVRITIDQKYYCSYDIGLNPWILYAMKTVPGAFTNTICSLKIFTGLPRHSHSTYQWNLKSKFTITIQFLAACVMTYLR